MLLSWLMKCDKQIHKNVMCWLVCWEFWDIWSEHTLNLSSCYELVSGFQWYLVNQVVEPVCVGLWSKLRPLIARKQGKRIDQCIELNCCLNTLTHYAKLYSFPLIHTYREWERERKNLLYFLVGYKHVWNCVTYSYAAWTELSIVNPWQPLVT